MIMLKSVSFMFLYQEIKTYAAYNLILVKNNKYISSPQRGASKISDSEKFGLKKI